MDYLTNILNRSPSGGSHKSSHSKSSIDSNHLNPVSPTFNPHTLTNTDPLPTSPTALEGRLNHHSSQLQKLATRIETVNEWLALDVIVLQRLEKEVEEERPKTAKAASPVKNVQDPHSGPGLRIVVPPTPTLDNNTGNPPSPLLGSNVRTSRPTVSKQTRHSSYTIPTHHEKTVQTLVAAAASTPVNEPNNSIFEIRTRITSMQRWRRELERAVVWQREECWRVEKALGRRREGEENVQPRKQGKEGAERRSSGRLPSQNEWETLFRG